MNVFKNYFVISYVILSYCRRLLSTRLVSISKTKSWWEKNAPDKLYKNDYIMALCEHAFSWTFMIMLIPTIYTYFNPNELIYKMYVFVFCFNWVIHCIIDDCKANKKNINLIQDQLIHILQIVITWIVFIAIR